MSTIEIETDKLSKTNQVLIYAFDKGYRIINGKIFNPKNKELSGGYRVLGGVKYHVFAIKFDKKSFPVKVHKLVAYQKFKQLLFKSGTMVRHLDGNSINNLESNIEIGTASDNMFDKTKSARLVQAIKASSKNRKFSDQVVEEIKYKHKMGASYRELMLEYNISSKGTISFLIHNNYQTTKNFTNKN